MKKLCFVLIMTVLLSLVLAGCIVNTTAVFYAENPAITSPREETEVNVVNEEQKLVSAPNNASGDGGGLTSLSTITNPVIFICFAGEQVLNVRNTITVDIINMFNAEDNSLKDYYRDLSYGSLTINSIFPITNGDYYVYTAPNNRNYYDNVSSSQRASAEAALLNGAVEAANNYFDYTNRNLDGNNDGFVDMVSFVVSGQKSEWGGLLWPHSWSLKSISTTPKKLNNIPVNEFNFTFLEGYKVGYVCHETGHILGMPDLYHYDYNKDRYPAWEWDLMHYNNNTPQYTTTYMRYKYLNFVNDNQIGNLLKSGDYTLKPTTISTQNDILAYKIEINEYESIWIEYRNNQVSTYDSELPGSGLIVYRINNKVTGNTNGRYQSVQHPDELYVYRPEVQNGNELSNIGYAYVSQANTHFPKIGVISASKNYDQSAIYLTNGQNTGIIITPTVQNDLSITFTVQLGAYDRSAINEIKVLDTNYQMYYGETPLPNVKIKYQGFTSYVTPLYSRLTFQYDSSFIGTQTATVTYTDSENTLSTDFSLTIKDKVAVDGVTVSSNPIKQEYDINESINLIGLVFTITTISGAVEQKVYSLASKADWAIEGVDITKSGIYSAKITYLPLSVFSFVEIRVMAGLSGIIVLKEDTIPFVKGGNPLSLNVKGVNTDGTFRNLERYEYRISDYDTAKYFEPQTIRVVYNQNEEFYYETTIYVARGTLERINLTKPNRTDHAYGAKLNLEGGSLGLEYLYNGDNYRIDIPMYSYYTAFNSSYSPSKVGEQYLSIKVDGATCTLKVSVLSQSNALLSIAEKDKSYINISGSTIYLKKEYSVKDLESAFMSYLDIYFVLNNELIINSNTYPNMYVGSKVKIQLNNEETAIINYNIVLMGDTNNDGRFNDADIFGMVRALMEEKTNLLYLDLNGDNVYTLTDFVLWVALLEGKQ